MRINKERLLKETYYNPAYSLVIDNYDFSVN